MNPQNPLEQQTDQTTQQPIQPGVQPPSPNNGFQQIAPPAPVTIHKPNKYLVMIIIIALLAIPFVMFFTNRMDTSTVPRSEANNSPAVQSSDSTSGIDRSDQLNKVVYVQSVIAEMTANNMGVLPTTTQEFNDYIDSTRQADTLQNTMVIFQDSFSDTNVPQLAGELFIYPAHTCKDTDAVAGSSRQFAVIYAISATDQGCESY